MGNVCSQTANSKKIDIEGFFNKSKYTSLGSDVPGKERKPEISTNVSGSVSAREFNSCSQMCQLINFDTNLCQGGYTCQASPESVCDSTNCTCIVTITCREINKKMASLKVPKDKFSHIW